jgi:hypothetical protein
MMTRFLAGVLSVIALGVMLIAYGLLSAPAAGYEPRLDANQPQYPWLAGQQVGMQQPGPYQAGYQPAFAAPSYLPQGYQPQYVYVDRSAPPAAYYGYPAYSTQAPVAASPVYLEPRPVRTTTTATAAQPTTTRVVQRAPRRDWRKTALVVGGSTATGAGLGAIFGGKKGALIGAAIGGGASTIYESTKR